MTSDDQPNRESPAERFLCRCSNSCSGIPIPSEYLEDDDERECPICFDGINSQKVVMLGGCRHVFCPSCMDCCDENLVDKQCPMCRERNEVFTFDRPIVPERHGALVREHLYCVYKANDCQYLNEYVKKLNKDWLSLVGFIFKTQHRSDRYYRGRKGTEHLKLTKYESDGRLLSKGESYATIKTESGKIRVVISCLLTNMSVRVMISEDDYTDFEVDNDYADKAIVLINGQLSACWRVLSQMLDRKHVQRGYVRKFDDHTCTLFLSGVHDIGLQFRHDMVGYEEIRHLAKCNFDPSHFRKFRTEMPPVSTDNCDMGPGYDDEFCCHNRNLFVEDVIDDFNDDDDGDENYYDDDEEEDGNVENYQGDSAEEDMSDGDNDNE